MRKWLVAILGVVLILGLALPGCKAKQSPASSPVPALPGPASAAGRSILLPSQPMGIQVVGRGEVKVKPDVALINLGVEAQAKTAAEARTQAAQAMSKILEALKANGVAERDIRTYRLSIQPVKEYERESRREILVSFRVTNLVTAKSREIDKAGAIIDAAVEAGGDFIRVQGISFKVEDPKPFYAQAREKAVAEAKAKAQQLANLTGVTLGKPVYISESGGYYPPGLVYYAEKAGGLPVPAPAPTPISPGEQTISLTVQITFSIQ